MRAGRWTEKTKNVQKQPCKKYQPDGVSIWGDERHAARGEEACASSKDISAPLRFCYACRFNSFDQYGMTNESFRGSFDQESTFWWLRHPINSASQQSRPIPNRVVNSVGPAFLILF